MEEKELSNRRFISLIIMGFICVVLLVVIFYLIYSYEKCESWDCFNNNLASCSRTRFAGGKEIIFGYVIEGRTEKGCKVEVEFIGGQVGRNSNELKNKKMTCYTPYGIVMLPESDLSNCNGELKEKLQEEIINQLHNYIVQNLGQINKEIIDPFSVISS